MRRTRAPRDEWKRAGECGSQATACAWLRGVVRARIGTRAELTWYRTASLFPAHLSTGTLLVDALQHVWRVICDALHVGAARKCGWNGARGGTATVERYRLCRGGRRGCSEDARLGVLMLRRIEGMTVRGIDNTNVDG